MSETRDHGVPTWDGSARTWRRYTREVAWFVQATPTHKRRYCASRLLSKLTGPARLLAMSWSRMAFDSPSGTKQLLQRLAASPLVRKTLPNAAAICSQYFAFQRRPSETIGNFLVRESLVHEEFCEAIIRLHEDRLGISQESRDFGLPVEQEEEWSDSAWRSSWWHDDAWWEDDYDFENSPDHGPDGDSPEAEGQGDDLPARDGGPPAEPQIPGATGSSPSHQGPGSTTSRVPRRADVAASVAVPEEPVKAMDEMTLADSFILEVLRGWRLLQAAGVTPDEKRDILSTTKNSLDFETIAAALQNLWDDQLLGHRGQGHNGSYMANYAAASSDDGSLYYHDAWEYEYDDPYYDSWWEDSFYASEAYDDYDWHDDGSQGYAAHVEHATVKEEDDEKVKEAQQAERVAESLALEAQRTWAEAQRASQALRRDRGFGKSGPSSASNGPMRCFLCGGPHLARDCPDRRHPGSYKGKGGLRNYMTETDDYYVNFSGKGKYKGKGKHAHHMWMDGLAMWKGKGKTKGKVKGKDSQYRQVNAYNADMYLGGLEMADAMNASTTTSPPPDPRHGMLDCGATASAAPEAVVQDLIAAVLTQDKGAKIELDQFSRPYFRFGNGRWGRAMCRVHISSSASGSPQHFSLYTLPNPENYDKETTDKSSLVPVLIGMDHMGSQGVGMMIDFAAGLAMNTKESNPDIYKLSVNHKGHFVLDIVEHLTKGHQNLDGQAHVVVRGQPSSHTVQHDHQFLELGTAWMDLTACDEELDARAEQEARARMWKLYEASRSLRSNIHSSVLTAAEAQTSMCGQPAPLSSSSTSPPRTHVNGLRAAVQGLPEEQDTPSQEGSRARLREGDEGRPQGSEDGCQSVAMLQPARGHEALKQQLGSLAPLCDLQCSPGVHSPGRSSWSNDKAGSSINDSSNAERAPRPPWRSDSSDGGHLRSYAAQNRCGGTAPQSDQGGDKACRDQADSRISHINKAQDETHDSDNEPRKIFHGELGSGDDRSSGRVSRGSVRGSRPSAVKSSKPFGPCSLPLRIGQKLMALATMMTATLATAVTEFSLAGRDGLWEIACAPHSWLSEAAEGHGLHPRRINLQAGYDLYQESTWQQLRELRRRHRPRRLWFSLPCTKWCAWTSVNYNTEDKRQQLETARRKERKLLWYVNVFIKEALLEDEDVEVFFEWPWPCFGWKQQAMIDLANHLDKIGVPWLQCRIDGCVYGMMDKDNLQFIKKKWLVMTTSETFHKQFRAKVCPGNHGQHSTIQGLETSLTAYYPWKLVQSIARLWRDQHAPVRHLRLLERNDDLPALRDLQSLTVGTASSMVGFETDEDLYGDLHMVQEADFVGCASTSHQQDDSARDLVRCASTSDQQDDSARGPYIQMLSEAGLSRNMSFESFEQVMLAASQHLGQTNLDHLRWQKGAGRVLVMGAYSHGRFVGVCKKTYMHGDLVRYVNQFAGHHLPKATWSSMMISLKCPALPHRDCHNAKGQFSHLVCVGPYEKGGLWLAGTPPQGLLPVRRQVPDGSFKVGYIVPTWRKTVSFDPHVWHASQRWTGHRIAISLYTTRMTPFLSTFDRNALQRMGFPLPSSSLTSSTMTTEEIQHYASAVTPQDELPEGVSQEEFDKWEASVNLLPVIQLIGTWRNWFPTLDILNGKFKLLSAMYVRPA